MVSLYMWVTSIRDRTNMVYLLLTSISPIITKLKIFKLRSLLFLHEDGPKDDLLNFLPGNLKSNTDFGNKHSPIDCFQFLSELRNLLIA